MLGLVLPWWTRWAVLAVALLAAAAFGAAKMHEHDQSRYDALEAQFEAFKDKTAALGREAKAAADAREAADKQRKETADAENSAALATLADSVAKLRARPGSGRLPSPPTCPGGSTEADQYAAKLERAYGVLVGRLRGGADEASGETVDLNTAKRWAQTPQIRPNIQ